MAIILTQQPVDFDKYVHTYNDMSHYVASSTEFAELKYRYKFTVSDYNGIVVSTKNAPAYNAGVGIFNPARVLKNRLQFKFNPNITAYAKCPGTLIQYKVNVADTGITPTYNVNSTKVIMLNSYKENFDFYDYVLNGDTKKMLTDWTSVRKVTQDDRGTLRMLSGTMINVSDTTSTSFSYRTIVVKTIANGNKYYYRSAANSDYGSTTLVGLSSNNNTLQDLQAYAVDVPAYPYNINNGSGWTYFAYQLVGGSYTELPTPTLATNILSNAISYEIYARDLAGNKTSKSEYFEIVDVCDVTPVQLGWRNALGGTDFATITKYKTKNNTFSKQSYIKNKNLQDASGLTINYNSLNRGETIINNDSTLEYILNTDWLTKEELSDYSGMFESSDVFMRIEDTWYPVILTNEAVTVETDVRGLKNLTITLRLANKTYIQ